MANLAPDPQTLESWEDAFQHPLPVVRKLEQQLRKNIDENRQKLRSLVGTSYRDLLGTAERIIEMDAQVQQAESYMGDIGRKCNARMLERIAENQVRMKKMGGSGLEERCRVVAQVKVLQSAVAVSGRIVKSGGDALLAAKLLVLARLLHKSVSEGVKPPAELENLRKRLGLARKRLLAYIARSSVRANEEKEGIANTLCAYSLITSSSPKDVLRYFLQNRFEQLQNRAETPSEEGILEMLDLYSQTLLDTRELFPRRFTDTLSQLSKAALVQDPDVRSVFHLSLDIYEQWIADDVRNFHPWVRHDQLTSSEVGDALASWSKQAQKCLLQGLTDTLKEQGDAQSVLTLRHDVLTKYLSLSAKLHSVGHSQAISDIRAAFIDRLESLASKAAGVPILELDVKHTGGAQSQKAWDMAALDMDIGDGAVPFRKAVVQKQHGRDATVEHTIRALDEWVGRLEDFAKVLSTMRSVKWDDDLDLDLDDLNEGESLQTALNKDDPKQLELKLNQETTAALQQMYRVVEKSPDSESNPALLIRIIREIDRRRRSIIDRLDKAELVKVDKTFVEALHRKVAVSITEGPVKGYASRGHANSHIPVSLWDGTPPLPIQPAIATFRFLKELHSDMSNAGNDLWSPDAVKALKRSATEQLSEHLSLDWVDEAKAMPLTNGHSHGEGDEAASSESTNDLADKDVKTSADTDKRLIQHMFDVLYVQRVLRTAGSGRDKMDALVDEMKRRLEFEDASVERLRKNANEYWKRTYLLFGLLANAHH